MHIFIDLISISNKYAVESRAKFSQLITSSFFNRPSSGIYHLPNVCHAIFMYARHALFIFMPSLAPDFILFMLATCGTGASSVTFQIIDIICSEQSSFSLAHYSISNKVIKHPTKIRNYHFHSISFQVFWHTDTNFIVSNLLIFKIGKFLWHFYALR
jgi:hypothetical protein